jgi:predicted RNase H-like nuclease (RuvC/YqgF family)
MDHPYKSIALNTENFSATLDHYVCKLQIERLEQDVERLTQDNLYWQKLKSEWEDGVNKINKLKCEIETLKRDVESLKNLESKREDKLRELENKNKIVTEKLKIANVVNNERLDSINNLKAKMTNTSSKTDIQNEEMMVVENCCKICLERKRDVVFVPCGHVYSCKKCASKLFGKCPICRTVSKTVKLYFC